MSRQGSIVHIFFPCECQVTEKTFLSKNCFTFENSYKSTLKYPFGSHKIFVSHQRSIAYLFPPLCVLVIVKIFLIKIYFNNEN